MEFVLGGIAACGACLITNPLEVTKTRMQLQGELTARGHYHIHYKNVFHAFYTIAKVDGLLALQKGLVPALWYQLFMNGARLGVFQCFINWNLVNDGKGRVSFARSVVAGATSGCFGALIGSPAYMIKTHLQAKASERIAVGYQHNHAGFYSALVKICREQGVFGLWRGVHAAMLRVMVGSATQLSTFTWTKDRFQYFPKDSWKNAFVASSASGCATVLCMTPFDVVSTRLYNQGLDKSGKGLFYDGLFDCFRKIFLKEGFYGFYKGWGASLFRLGPHTVISLMLWNQIRVGYIELQQKLSTI